MPDEKSGQMRTSYQSNSHKAKAKAAETEGSQEKRVDKVITGEAIARKKPLGRRIAETFTGEDAHSVGTYVLFEVMLPALKTMISDAASQGVERMLFGDSRPSSRVGARSVNGYTSYNRVGQASATSTLSSRPLSQRARATHDFREIILETRGQAEVVMERLGDLISQYGVATVADLYELVGVTGSFTDDKWGWPDLRDAGIRRVREGFLMMLPAPTALD